MPSRSRMREGTDLQCDDAFRLRRDAGVKNTTPPCSCSFRRSNSALQLSRDLDVQYKTAFVLAHKLREIVDAEQRKAVLAGVCEIDGAYFGGKSKQKNKVTDRIDRRAAGEQTGKRRVVVVMREREGRTLPHVFNKESEALPTIRKTIPRGSTVHALAL